MQAEPEPGRVLASVPPGQWRQISPGCNQGRHLGCQGCDCECHPPPGWSLLQGASYG